MNSTITYEAAAKLVRQTALAVSFHKGSEMTFDDIINWGDGHKFDGISRQFIADQAELAGYPIRTN